MKLTGASPRAQERLLELDMEEAHGFFKVSRRCSHWVRSGQVEACVRLACLSTCSPVDLLVLLPARHGAL